MLMHDVRLALRSLKRNPILSTLMIGAIAVGIAASMIAITLYHARSGHPIPWKADTLYAVTMDLRDDDPDQGFSEHPEYPPFQLAYPDAKAVYQSDIPVRSVMMYRAGRVVAPENRNVKPFGATIRVTTADFFQTFDVPFIQGNGWSRADDESPAAVVVLSRFMNDKLFGSANSVGREVTLTGKQFRVVGVIDTWMPQPKYYDLNASSGFDVPEDFFIPFGWMQALKLGPNGNVNCVSKRAKIESFDAFITQDCVWLQFWVEFRKASDRDRYQAFIDNYVSDQKRHDRFPHKLNNRIVNVPGAYEIDRLADRRPEMYRLIGEGRHSSEQAQVASQKD